MDYSYKIIIALLNVEQTKLVQNIKIYILTSLPLHPAKLLETSISRLFWQPWLPPDGALTEPNRKAFTTKLKKKKCSYFLDYRSHYLSLAYSENPMMSNNPHWNHTSGSGNFGPNAFLKLYWKYILRIKKAKILYKICF